MFDSYQDVEYDTQIMMEIDHLLDSVPSHLFVVSPFSIPSAMTSKTFEIQDIMEGWKPKAAQRPPADTNAKRCQSLKGDSQRRSTIL